jgi:arsenate reductase
LQCRVIAPVVYQKKDPAMTASTTLYGIKTCDTCRKALKALEGAGHSVSFVDVRDTPLSAAQIATFQAAFGPALLNTRSTTWRGLSAAEQAHDPAALLQAHPTLMKRPVIDRDGALTLGWDRAVQATLLT